MLTKVEIENSQGGVLELPLEEFEHGFKVQSIEGLDPVKATLVTTSFANLDGMQYHSSRREARNIKVQFGFEPDYTKENIRTLRNALYKFLMPKTEVKIRFHTFNEFDESILTQNLLVEIVGRIETFESPMFTKDPAVDISIMCFDPDFVDPVPKVMGGMSTAGLDEVVLTYDGSVETGVLFALYPDRDVDAFTIYHQPPDGTLRILDFTEPLLAGDVLKISTIIGEKYVTRTRAGVEASLLYGMTPQSNWLELLPGENILRVYAVGAGVPYDFTYTLKHGGL